MTAPRAAQATDRDVAPVTELRRTLGLLDLTSIAIGTVIGSGIFLVPGVVLRETGTQVGPALLVWVAAGILSYLGALTYAEMGAMKPDAGGLDKARSFAPDLVNKSVPEHNEMRRMIAQLRQTRPGDASFDATLLEMMRDVMRHVADEETMLLPDAERVLGERRLSELGAEMTRRRFELATPHAGEIAVNTVRTFPGATLAFSGLLVLGAFLVGRAATRNSTSLPTLRKMRSATSLPAVRKTIARAARPARLRSTSQSLLDRLRDAVVA